MTDDLLPSPADDLGLRLERLASAGERTLHLPGPAVAARAATRRRARRTAALATTTVAAAAAALVWLPRTLPPTEPPTGPTPQPTGTTRVVGRLTVTPDPPPVRAGRRLILAGNGCSGTRITVRLDGHAAGGLLVGKGGFSARWQLPRYVSAGSHTLVADCGDGTTLPPVTVVSAAAVPVEWAANPPRTVAGGSLTFEGSGCPPRTNVSISVEGVTGGELIAVADGDGRFAQRWRVPSGTRRGDHQATGFCVDTGDTLPPLTVTIR